MFVTSNRVDLIKAIYESVKKTERGKRKVWDNPEITSYIVTGGEKGWEESSEMNWGRSRGGVFMS